MTGITLIVKKNMLNGLLEMVLIILFLLTVMGIHGEFNFLIQLNLNTAFSLRTQYTF